MLYFLQQLLNGFHSGALYALLAFGYALTNGVLKRTNLAHGPVFAFAGQVMILVAVFGWHVLWLTLPATVALGIASAFVYAALIATILARSVFLPLAESSPNAIVVATLGVSLVLMELARIAAETRDFWLPPMLADPVVCVGERLPGDPHRHPARQLRARGRGHRPGGPSCRARGSAAPGGPSATIRLAAAMCGVDVRGVFYAAVLGGALLAALAGIHGGALLRQHQLRHRPGLRAEGPVRHGGRRLSRPVRAPHWARPASASPNRYGPAISRSNGATPGCLRFWWRCWCSPGPERTQEPICAAV